MALPTAPVISCLQRQAALSIPTLPHQVVVPLGLVALRADHEPHRLVEGVDLVRLQVLDDVRQPVEQLADERLALLDLRGATGVGGVRGGAGRTARTRSCWCADAAAVSPICLATRIG